MMPASTLVGNTRSASDIHRVEDLQVRNARFGLVTAGRQCLNAARSRRTSVSSIAVTQLRYKSAGIGIGATARLRLHLLSAKASISFSPDRKNSKKLSPLHLQVSQTLRSTKYSRIPFSVTTPSKSLRSNAKALMACSALLLFHGTPSKLKKVKRPSRFFSNRVLHFSAVSV